MQAMRGLWKPVTAWLVASAAIDGLLWFRGGGQVELAGYVALPLAVGALLALIVARAARLPAKYLDGLREGGPVEVLEDELAWTGGRRIVARNAAGAWVLESTSGAKNALLFVKGPGQAEPAMVRGDARKAGRAAAGKGR